jgi:light-regulated signal transduction histidine kinase (bacteriophytochrome)
VKIYSELVEQRYRSSIDEQGLEFLGFIRNGASRMETLVRDLLTYTRITRLNKAVEVASSIESLKGVLANLAGMIAESQAEVVVDWLPPVRVHSTHLQQLFQNLIGNAIKYRRVDVTPLVHVTAERQAGSWQFSVADNGIGIEPQFKERIFGLFKRLHTSEEYSGSGIGLAICQRIVEQYHGRIWVESKPGQGATFIFTIPG